MKISKPLSLKFCRRRAVVGFIWSVFASIAVSATALDSLDSEFNPVILGPGSVSDLMWNPEGFLYAAVLAEKVNGEPITSNLVRMVLPNIWDSTYQPTIAGYASILHIQADGKFLVGGTFSEIEGHPTQNLARMNPDGTVDTTFTATSAVSSGGKISALVSGSDGSVLVGMEAGTIEEGWVDGEWVVLPSNVLIKLNPDGGQDHAFTPTFGQPESRHLVWWPTRLNAIAIQTDGKILVGGNFNEVNGTAQDYLARLNSDGSLDASYRPVLTHSDDAFFSPSISREVRAIAFTDDGLVAVGGTFSGVNGHSQVAIAKLTPEGEMDPDFRVLFDERPSLPPFGNYVSRIRVDSAGRLIILGGWEVIHGLPGFMQAARVDRHGLADPAFSAQFSSQDSVVVLPGDEVVFGRNGALSLNYVIQSAIGGNFADGSTNPLVQLDLRVRNSPDFFSTRPGSGPVVGGTWILEVDGGEHTGLTALTSSGARDPDFNVTLSPKTSAKTVLRLPDGRFLVGGGFSQVNGASRPRLALCRADGTTDLLFDLGSGPNGTVDVLRMMPTGKVLAVGNFSQINGRDARGIALLDLSKVGVVSSISVLDIVEARYGSSTTFSDVTQIVRNRLVGGRLTLTVSSSNLGGDPAPGQSKHLTLRYLTEYGERTTSVAELHSITLPNLPWDSGLIDPAFRPENTGTPFLMDAAGSEDGKILLVGSFSSFAGNSIRNMVRLNSDGSFDPSFTPQDGFSSFVPTLVRTEPSGKIYIGGSSLRRNGAASAIGVHRLHPSGLPDDSFTGAPFIFSVSDLVPLRDGRLFVGGNFQGNAIWQGQHLVRLQESGAVDPTFDAGNTFNPSIEQIGLVPPDQLYLAGRFSLLQGQERTGLSRIRLNQALPPQAKISLPGSRLEGESFAVWLDGLGEDESIRWYLRGQLVQEGGATFSLDSLTLFDAGMLSATVINSAGSASTSTEVEVREFSFIEWSQVNGLSGDSQADFDGDGRSDYAEYVARTDPRDPASFLKKEFVVDADTMSISWPTFPGRRYTISTSDDLNGWTTIYGPIIGSGRIHEAELPLQDSHRSFFRLEVEQP